MVRRTVVALLLASAGVGAAHASDTPLYQPAPAWVVPAAMPDVATLGSAAPVYLVNDTQDRFQDGTVWNYREIASHPITDATLAELGTVKISWHPDHGDLIIHKAEIVRGAEHVDLLKTGKFTVLRREQELEQFQINGILTATMAVEGLRIGDVLDIRYSTTNHDPALKGNMQGGAALLVEPLKVSYTRTRLLWPEGVDLRWKAYPVGATPQLVTAKGWHEVSFTGLVPKQPELPGDAPRRYNKPSLVEATTFTDWQAVSKVMAPLYATQGLIAPGSPLAAEVATITAATPDPMKRTAMALALVQEKVRYLFNGMEGGNYVPQTPAQTWSMRYGDCKAKTLLLLSILRAMNIEAEPTLANIGGGDLVPESLPSAGTFNHIFVHAKVGGQDLWLDGTDRGARIEDMGDVPPFRWVLPVRTEGAALLQLPNKAPARPGANIVVDLDESGGIGLASPFTVSFTVRGSAADQFRTFAAQASKDDLRKMATSLGLGAAGGSGIVGSYAFSFDDTAGTATIQVHGVANTHWEHEEKRYRLVLDPSAGKQFNADRSRATWKDIPVATGNPSALQRTMRIHLPDNGAGFALDGDQTVDDTWAGVHVTRKTTLSNGVLTLEERRASSGVEIAPADIAAVRAKMAALQSRQLRLSSAVDYPSPWSKVEAAKRAHKFDAALALYDQAVAAKSDEAQPYLERAQFEVRIGERKKALADLDKAVSLDATRSTYLARAQVNEQLGDRVKAIADAKAALDLDSGNKGTISRLALLQADAGDKTDALALLAPKIDEGGKDKSDYLNTKAEVLGRTGDKDGAIAAIDEAVTAKPGSAQMLNARCWIKGTLNVALDTALKDCTKSIELSDDSAATALDSRGMVYFRMNRMDDALTDLNAALDLRPEQAASLYLRGIVLRRTGDAKRGDADIAFARWLSPQIDHDYARYGVAP